MRDQLKSVSRQRLMRGHPAQLRPSEIEAIRFVLRQFGHTLKLRPLAGLKSG